MAQTPDVDVTGLLASWAGGDRGALNQLIPLVYEELRRLAHRELRRERSNGTLVTTALAHEADLRLVDQSRAQLESRFVVLPGPEARYYIPGLSSIVELHYFGGLTFDETAEILGAGYMTGAEGVPSAPVQFQFFR